MHRFRLWLWRIIRTLASEFGMWAERMSRRASMWTDKAQAKIDGDGR
jgi:hypothetical protein